MQDADCDARRRGPCSALASARERLKAKTAAHPAAAKVLEAGDAVQTYASITRKTIDEPMPPCKIDVKLKEGDEIKIGKLKLKVVADTRTHAGATELPAGSLLFSGDNIYKDVARRGYRRAFHGSNLPDFISSRIRIRDDDAEFLCRATVQFFRAKTPRFYKMPSTG